MKQTSKTLIVEEGNPACLLVTDTGGKMRQTAKEFATALAAFKWCQRGRIKMVYLPPGTVADPLRN